MVVEEAISSTSELVFELGKIGKWIQAVGLVVILWIVIQAFHFFLNRKRSNFLKKMEDNIERIERKIDKLSKKK
jgi:purine-cytosine permease-like protein